ncbi:MAG: hypothetical protein QG612_350 [Pseudomonadota bacterium]|nr:hypothetical protein [Pseudomonadota bacterium]
MFPGLFPWLVPALAALLGYALAVLPGEQPGRSRLLPLAWLAHGLAGVMHLFGLGEGLAGVRFGFAPALAATAWMVIGLHAVESRFVPVPGVRRWLAVAGGATLLLAMLFPGEGVRVASPWAPLHWMLGLASYGLVAVAVLHAGWLDRTERQLRDRARAVRLEAAAGRPGLPLLTLERLTYRFVAAGFGMLTLALLLGTWSTPVWHWDHKTVFSLLGWMVLAGLLAGRHFFGWRGRRATRWLYAGGVLLLLAYVGSRFVLEVLLHRPPLGA